jgi:hypothetical protein
MLIAREVYSNLDSAELILIELTVESDSQRNWRWQWSFSKGDPSAAIPNYCCCDLSRGGEGQRKRPDLYRTGSCNIECLESKLSRKVYKFATNFLLDRLSWRWKYSWWWSLESTATIELHADYWREQKWIWSILFRCGWKITQKILDAIGEPDCEDRLAQ